MQANLFKEVGQIVDTATGIFARYHLALVVLALLASVVGGIYAFYITTVEEVNYIAIGLTGVLYILVTLSAQLGLILQVGALEQGGWLGYGEALRRASHYLPKVLALLVFMFLLVVVTLMPLLALSGFGSEATESYGALWALMMGSLAAIFLVITVRLCFVVPAVVLDGMGIASSIKTSLACTRGGRQFVQVLLLLVVSAMVVTALVSLPNLVVTLLNQLQLAGVEEASRSVEHGVGWQRGFQILIEAWAMPVVFCNIVVSYRWFKRRLSA